MSWTKKEIEQMTGVLLRRLHGDGRDRDEVETVCQLAETSIMNRESCEGLMEEIESLKAQLAQRPTPKASSAVAGGGLGIPMPRPEQWDAICEGVLCGYGAIEIEFEDTARAYFKQAYETIVPLRDAAAALQANTAPEEKGRG